MTLVGIQLDEEDKSPKYKQIANSIEKLIAKGLFKSGDKLPTHRRLADRLIVTVGTVTRAYAEAERRGLIEARVGSGTYVANSTKDRWAFVVDRQRLSGECHFGFNTPPMVDRSGLLQEAMAGISRSPQVLNDLMNYQSPEGIESHKAVMAKWLQKQGVHIVAEKMLFSSGAQHGLQMVFDALTRAGDTILTEQLTYPGIISLARQKRLTLKGVEMDAQGILPEALDAACRQCQVNFIYLTPTFQNPTSATMSVERRRAVLAICRQHDLYVIEDDVNGLLTDNPPSPMVNLEPDRVIHIGAVSKCLAPGLRVGYLQPPPKLYQPLRAALQNHSWMVSPLLTALTCELITSSKLATLQSDIKHEMASRLKLTLDYLGEYQPQFNRDCFHLWLKLPDYWRLSDFIERAKKEGVTVESAELFTPPAASVPPAIRLVLSSPFDRAELEYGLSVLKALLAANSNPNFCL